MDVLSSAMQQNMQMVSSAVSTLVLQKAMGVDAQSIAGLLDMMPQAPSPQLAPKAGSMDISV